MPLRWLGLQRRICPGPLADLQRAYIPAPEYVRGRHRVISAGETSVLGRMGRAVVGSRVFRHVMVSVLVAACFVAVHAESAFASTPPLQLPWPTGQVHWIQYGYSYNCGDHVGRDLYAIDFQFSAGQPVSAVADGTA